MCAQVDPPRPVPVSVLCLRTLSALRGSEEEGRIARKQQQQAAPHEQPNYVLASDCAWLSLHWRYHDGTAVWRYATGWLDDPERSDV